MPLRAISGNNRDVIRVAIMTENTSMGGIGRYCLSLADNLKSYPDVQVQLVSPYEKASDNWLIDETNRRGLILHLLPMEGTFDLRIIWRLGTLLKREQIAIVHSQGYRSGLISRLAIETQRLPVKSVCTVHGIYQLFSNQRTKYYLLADLLMKRIFGDVVIAVSNQMKSELVRRGLETSKIKVVPNGTRLPAVDLSAIRCPSLTEFGLAPSRKTIGYVGRLSVEKGVSALAQIAGRILTLRPDTQLLVVGDGSDRAVLDDLQQEFPGRVVLAGFQDNVDRFYPLMDFAIFPSQDEGMPLALLEAMSYSIPVVATAVGGVPEVISSGLDGFLFSPQDIDGMVQKSLELIQDSTLRQQVGQNARRKVEKEFTDKAMTKRTWEIYRSLSA